jgi:hypothetical protein
MSINDENEYCNYYNEMKIKLKPWLKNIIIKKYIIPEETADLFNPNESISSNRIQTNLQPENGKKLPIHCLSMYYNDNKCFKMACEYADNNNFEYDYYMKYRSDIINSTVPIIYSKEKDNIHLYCAIPLCNFTSGGLFKKPIICDAFAWGNRKTMSIYCNTYKYCILKNKEYNGKYYIAFECSLTDNIYENNVPVSYCNMPYNLDKNRRMFDSSYNNIFRILPNQYIMNINDLDSTKHIDVEPQE